MIVFSSYGFRGIMQERFKSVLPDKNKKILIVPLAGMTCEITGKAEKEGAWKVGFPEDKISVFMDSNPEEFLHQQFDVIYVPGGNTFKLLHDVRKYHLDKLILDNFRNGADYIGVSAGAYLACPNIEYVMKIGDDDNHIKGGDYSGLHLTDKYPLCHYDVRGLPYYRICREALGESADIITINNEDLIIL